MLAIFWPVFAVEKGPLLRVDQHCASGSFLDLYRRYGDRYPRLVAVHNVSIHDALTRYDVLVVGIIGIDRPFVRAAIELPSSDPEVKLIGLREPLSFSFRVRPGSEYSCRRGAVSTLDDESGVSYRSFGHDILL